MNNQLADTFTPKPNEAKFEAEELTLTLDQLKSLKPNQSLQALKTQNLSNNKSKVCQSIKEVRRRLQRSLESNSQTLNPKINEKSRKLSDPRNRSSQQLQYKQSKGKLRPQDVIPSPDISSVKHLFEKKPSQKTEKKNSTPLKLGIVEKTEFFCNKKKEVIKKALIEKEKKISEECPFKPDLTKNGQSGLKEGQKDQNGGNNEKHFSNPTFSKKNPESKKSCDYDEISPVRQTYSYKEGLDIQKLIDKSRPLLKYTVTRNQYN